MKKYILFIYISPIVMGIIIPCAIVLAWHAQMNRWNLCGCEITVLLFGGTALLSFICFILSGLCLHKRIKRYGWKRNVLSTLMVFPHIIFPLLVLQDFYLLPKLLRDLGEHILFGGIVLWITIFIFYTFWLENQYQKLLDKIKRNKD
jgi:hypothetical protein